MYRPPISRKACLCVYLQHGRHQQQVPSVLFEVPGTQAARAPVALLFPLGCSTLQIMRHTNNIAVATCILACLLFIKGLLKPCNPSKFGTLQRRDWLKGCTPFHLFSRNVSPKRNFRRFRARRMVRWMRRVAVYLISVNINIYHETPREGPSTLE